MDLKIKGKVAVVCGGSKGIGRAVCETLAADGCRVAVVARGRADMDATVERIRSAGGSAIGITADIGDTSQITAAVEAARAQLGPIDIAVWNGHTPKHGTFEDLSPQDFEADYHVLVTCFAAFVRAAVPDMKRNRWGRIVTVGSRSVKQPLRTHEVPYVLANTHRIAAVGLSKTLANELGPHGITVNTIGTGRFDTGAQQTSSAQLGPGLGQTPEAYVADRLKQIPLRRLGRPEEMAALVAFLVSEGGGYVTGETICCDGGRNESML